MVRRGDDPKPGYFTAETAENAEYCCPEVAAKFERVLLGQCVSLARVAPALLSPFFVTSWRPLRAVR